MRYSLADHILTIKVPATLVSSAELPAVINIGGEGSYVGSISISRSQSLYETTGDATGSWVHSKNLNKTGSVSISLSQLAPQVELLKNLFKIYEQSSSISEGLDIQVTEGDETVASCFDCYIGQIPEQSFADSASTQTWTFTCGKVMFE